MDEEGWNASIFRERTHMCSNYFSQWKNDFQRQPQLKSVVTICIALRLDPDSSNELLWSAGYRLRTDIKTHMLYAYLILKSYERGEEIKQEPDAIRRSRLITDEGKSLIIKYNTFLQENGCSDSELLGSTSYNTAENVN